MLSPCLSKKLDTNNLNNTIKMRYMPKEKFSAKEKSQKMFNVLSYQGIANQNDLEIYLTPIRMVKMINSSDSTCW